ncbi:MAG: hypothetical protein HC809_14550 [Gammaproteobacteria bacterium]|nr:hypothetical protein [Gammaproteobacteria bacterium]
MLLVGLMFAMLLTMATLPPLASNTSSRFGVVNREQPATPCGNRPGSASAAWPTGDGDCEALKTYRDGLRQRMDKEAQNLASLTGWDIGEIREKIKLPPKTEEHGVKAWWENLWN